MVSLYPFGYFHFLVHHLNSAIFQYPFPPLLSREILPYTWHHSLLYTCSRLSSPVQSSLTLHFHSPVLTSHLHLTHRHLKFDIAKIKLSFLERSQFSCNLSESHHPQQKILDSKIAPSSLPTSKIWINPPVSILRPNRHCFSLISDQNFSPTNIYRALCKIKEKITSPCFQGATI